MLGSTNCQYKTILKLSLEQVEAEHCTKTYSKTKMMLT